MTIDPQLPILIGAVGAFIVSMWNAVRGRRIYHLVNSAMTKVQAELAAANITIDELRETIVKLDKALRERVVGD